MKYSMFFNVMPRFFKRHGFLKYWFFTVFILFLITNTIDAVSSEELCDLICDPQLTKDENKDENMDDYKCRDEGARCEGFYHPMPLPDDKAAEYVPSSKFEIVGVIRGSFYFRSKEDKFIEIFAPDVSNLVEQPINIRAVGIPTSTYYRMDAKILPTEKFIWPIKEIVIPKKLSAEKIGIFGWIEGEKKDTKIYVPLITEARKDISNETLEDWRASDKDKTVKLYVRPTAHVEKVMWRSSPIIKDECSTDDKPWTTISEPREGFPIIIPISHIDTDRICVHVEAKIDGKEKWLSLENVQILMKF